MLIGHEMDICDWPAAAPVVGVKQATVKTRAASAFPFLTCFFIMGVRTKTVKRSAVHIIEKYYSRLTLDFDSNKRVCDEVAIIPSKRMRNKIAGYITHLMKRIQRGPVRGISLKLQEEERERRLDFVPEVSAINTDSIEIDTETRDLLAHLELQLPGVRVAQVIMRSHSNL
jgi:small subunit ribosomal protein S17e